MSGMINNSEYGRQVASALMDLLSDGKVSLDADGEAVVEQVSEFSEHYMSCEAGLFLRIRMGDGTAEVDIKIQARTDAEFSCELEQQETFTPDQY